MTEFQQLATYLASVFSSYLKQYNISSVEYNTGNKRNDKMIYGIEFNGGTLPNNSTISISILNYNEDYTYWIDNTNTYASTIDNKCIPINNIMIDSGVVYITTTDDKTNFTNSKIVLNYTK